MCPANPTRATTQGADSVGSHDQSQYRQKMCRLLSISKPLFPVKARVPCMAPKVHYWEAFKQRESRRCSTHIGAHQVHHKVIFAQAIATIIPRYRNGPKSGSHSVAYKRILLLDPVKPPRCSSVPWVQGLTYSPHRSISLQD